MYHLIWSVNNNENFAVIILIAANEYKDMYAKCPVPLESCSIFILGSRIRDCL